MFTRFKCDHYPDLHALLYTYDLYHRNSNKRRPFDKCSALHLNNASLQVVNVKSNENNPTPD